jgi:hypothetical protein
MYISKFRPQSKTRPRTRRIAASEDIDVIDDGFVEEEAVVIDPSATELVFETEDVAQLIAEVTGDTVEVEADEDTVVFTVGDADYTVEPEGDEEILETSRKVLRGKKSVDSACGTRKRSAVKSSRRAGRRTRK